MFRLAWISLLRNSIFSKLLATMIAMVAILVVMVAGFFVLVVFPDLSLTSEHALREYTRILTAGTPSLESARNISKIAHVEIRYRGPDGDWTTSGALPTIAEVREGRVRSSFGRHFYLEDAPQGGTYLVAWNLADQMHATHVKLLWMLLGLIVFVVLAAYWIQRSHLRPVRTLSDGITRMSGGDLDVALPVAGRDEFAILTEGFNDMVARVKQMIQARDQLLLDVSHELRSPITRLKVATALLPDGAEKEGMDADLNEMEAMIAELLQLERLRNPNGLRRTRQDLVLLLREVARTFDGRSPGVQVTAIPDVIPIDVDGEKIRTVLRNLLENAFKYSLPDSRPIFVSAEQTDETVIVQVQDDGVGVPEAQRSDIFEPFFRIDPSRSKKTGGYGLGLSICKRITEAHGATIRVENNRGRGCCFIVTFRDPLRSSGR